MKTILIFTAFLALQFTILKAENLLIYNASKGIENAYFNTISVEGEQLPYSQLQSFDDTFNIRNVILENFYLHGVDIHFFEFHTNS